jgi:hypothetical protein
MHLKHGINLAYCTNIHRGETWAETFGTLQQYSLAVRDQVSPGKPYAIAEWGLWGIDDPPFVEHMATFVRTHRRTEILAYYSGRPGSPWDLASKPRSRAAYRRLILPLG